MVILMFGPPGCGKGTQARKVVETLQIPAISTGDMLRAEMLAGTEVGKEVQQVVASGSLVSDELINRVVAGRIERPDCRNGFLLDGYPRTREQAVFIDGVLNSRGPAPVLALHLDVADEILVERVCARRSCPKCGRIYSLVFQPPKSEGVCDDCGVALSRRKDDCCEVARERLKAYHRQTGPAIEYFRSRRFHVFDGAQDPNAIFAEIEKVLEAELAHA